MLKKPTAGVMSFPSPLHGNMMLPDVSASWTSGDSYEEFSLALRQALTSSTSTYNTPNTTMSLMLSMPKILNMTNTFVLGSTFGAQLLFRTVFGAQLLFRTVTCGKSGSTLPTHHFRIIRF
jgi:hypothetical protein